MLGLQDFDGGCCVGFGCAVDFNDDEGAVFAFWEGGERTCCGRVSNGRDDGVRWTSQVDFEKTFADT